MDLLDTFLRESDELIAEFEAGLVALEKATDPAETVAGLFRAAHTLKGSAGMLGLSDFVQFAHVLEHVLGRVREGVLPVEAGVVDALLASADVMRAMVAAAAQGQAVGAVEGFRDTRRALEELLGGESVQTVEELPTEPRDLHVRLQLDCAPERVPDEANALLAELAQIGVVRDFEPALAPGVFAYSLVLHTAARRMDVEAYALFCNVQVQVEAATARAPEPAPDRRSPARAPSNPPKPVSRARAATTVRVDSERLDALVDLSCEMVIAAARAEQASAAGDARTRAELMEALLALVNDVQERAMSLRMVTIGDLFGRFARPVRDLARELGKQVLFEMDGVDTEFDRKLLDELADPLKHMVRNAIAHGIEAPALRAQRGKPSEGRLSLSARQENGAAIIEVRDDGAGVDPARVLAKAVERGLVAAGASPSRQEIYALLFLPGFSTAARVDEVAGRGVGLDVLKRKVEILRGSIEVSSELGKGTTFRVKLPTTLAVVDAMQVRVGHETLSIPLPAVVELVDLQAIPIAVFEGKNEYLDLRGEVLPVVRLERVLDLELAAGAGEMVVVVTSERRRFGLVVDKVLGLARAVIKPLERSYAFIQQIERTAVRPAGIGGATVLGDGSVGLILDIAGLDAMAFGA